MPDIRWKDEVFLSWSARDSVVVESDAVPKGAAGSASGGASAGYAASSGDGDVAPASAR